MKSPRKHSSLFYKSNKNQGLFMNQSIKQKPKGKNNKSAARQYAESFLVALIIALVIRALVIYPFRIPTGSMEDTLLVGDFLLANKFVYGLRSPDWIGIPYTKLGFEIPFFRTPGFRNPKQGDVVIFKYPRDPKLNYIKRCIAVSGDTIEVRHKKVYVNGKLFPDPPNAKYIGAMYPESYKEYAIFPPNAGNRDNYGPVRIPAPGDVYTFSDSNRSVWFERFQLIIYEGHTITLSYKGQTTNLTLSNQNRWPRALETYPVSSFAIDGTPLDKCKYIVKNILYFMMGDNRDNSLDSRYWGFLPERYVVGEGLIIYFSWNNELPFYRLTKKLRIQRILNLIH